VAVRFLVQQSCCPPRHWNPTVSGRLKRDRSDKLPTTSQADELAALVDAQDSVQKSTQDNYQNDTLRAINLRCSRLAIIIAPVDPRSVITREPADF
jgi:hypothetical protein